MCRRNTAVGVAAIIVAGLLPVSACRATCDQIAAQRHSLYRGAQGPTGAPAIAGESSEQPHARLIIPHARANMLLAEIVASARQELVVALPPLTVSLPGLADHVVTLPPLNVAAPGLRLAPARPHHVGLAIDLEFGLANSPVLGDQSGRESGTGQAVASATVHVEAKPAVEQSDSGLALRIGFAADSVRSIEPTLQPRGARALTDLVYRTLPASVRSRIPRSVVTVVLDRAIASLVSRSYGLVRQTVLRRLGAITELRIGLPDLPIAQVQVHSLARPAALVIDLRTELPVRHGLAAGYSIDPMMLGAVRLRLAGDVVTESANWAIEQGLAPTRYNRVMKPERDGDYVPLFAWRQGSARPLVVHVFRLSAPCGHIQLATRADLAVHGGKLAVTITDRNIEHVAGSTAVKLGIWLDTLWTRRFVRTEKRAAHTCISIGRQTLETQITDAQLLRSELVFALDFAITGQIGRAHV